MLNLFPIQFLALFAYLILRIFVACILIFLGAQHVRYRNELKHILQLSWFPFGTLVTTIFVVTEITLGLLIFVGAFTQIAMLLVGTMSLKMIFLRTYFHHHSIPSKIFYTLLFACSLSLFITGAGVLALDLPI